jgi:colanic acid biosynthesis protein WcaH
MPRLSERDFARLLEWAPLVSIDLLVTDSEGRLLVGERVNEPAKGFLFVPGGKIEKEDKTLSDALSRIAAYELGVVDPLEWDHARLHGAFMHRYETNAVDVAGLDTVYVVLAYRLRHPDDLCVEIDALPEDQHSSYFWISEETGDLPAEVHGNTLVYLREPTSRR